MRIQGLLIFICLYAVKSQTLEEGGENAEIFDSGIIEGPVAAALVDGEDADIGIKIYVLFIFKLTSLSQENILGMLVLCEKSPKQAFLVGSDTWEGC